MFESVKVSAFARKRCISGFNRWKTAIPNQSILLAAMIRSSRQIRETWVADTKNGRLG